jgi:hypothetical protein
MYLLFTYLPTYLYFFTFLQPIYLQEVTPSLYGLTNEQDATNARKVCWWVALELFFVWNKLKIGISLQWMAKQHQTTLKTFEAYSMGKLANGIRGEDWDAKCSL